MSRYTVNKYINMQKQTFLLNNYQKKNENLNYKFSENLLFDIYYFLINTSFLLATNFTIYNNVNKLL